tara:strand:+ start:445 stop:705 length:261 start_codon:yes stop_codon:yes gene_type:complete
MALIFLQDDCSQPAKKQRVVAVPEVRSVTVTKSDSASSLSLSSRSSTISKGSDRSTGSSKGSFAPLKPTAGEPGKRVRIAVGGNSR